MDVIQKRKIDANKATYGRTIIIGGSISYPGSILLAASACLKSGTGYVALGIEKKIYPYVVCKIKEVIYEVFPSFNNKKKLKRIVQLYDSIVFGNGIENKKNTQKALNFILKYYTKKLIIDATGLEILKEIGLDKLKKTKAQVIITPHLKEYSRLFASSIDNKSAQDLSIQVKKYAKKYSICIVLKDYRSVITDGITYYVITSGNAGLAHAGTGDVLAGFLGGIASYSKAPLCDIAYFAHDIFSLTSAFLVKKEKSLHSIQPEDIINTLAIILKKEKF